MSDSNSESSQSTEYNDNRKVFGAGSNDASNGGSVNITDGGAIKMAGRALDSSLGFAGGVVKEAFGFGTKTVNASLNASTEAFTEALSFSKFAQQNAANQTADALSFAQSASQQSARAQSMALDTATSSLGSALAYGGKQTAVALDSLTGSANLVKDAYADAKGRGALTDKILMIAIGMAGLVALLAVKGK